MKGPSALHLVRLMTAMLAGSSIARPEGPYEPVCPDPSKPAPKPEPPPVRYRRSTNQIVICIRCGEECEPMKGSGAKATAIFNGWRKLSEDQFDCPDCRKENPT